MAAAHAADSVVAVSSRRYCRIHHADLLLQDTMTGDWHRQGSTECHIVPTTTDPNSKENEENKAYAMKAAVPKTYYSIHMETTASAIPLEGASVAGHYLEYDASWIVTSDKEHVLVIPADHHPLVNAIKWHRSLLQQTSQDTKLRTVDASIANKMIVAVVSTQDDAPVTSLSDIYRSIFGGEFAFETLPPTLVPTNDTNATSTTTVAPEDDDTNSTNVTTANASSPSPSPTTTTLNNSATNTSSLSPAPSFATLVPTTSLETTINKEPSSSSLTAAPTAKANTEIPGETMAPSMDSDNNSTGPLELVSNATSTTTTTIINGTTTITTTTTNNRRRRRRRRRTQTDNENASFAAQHAACTLGHKVVVPYNAEQPIYQLTIPGLIQDYTFGSFYTATEPLLAALILNGTSSSSSTTTTTTTTTSLDQWAEYVVLIAPAGLRPASQQPNFRFVAAGAYNSYKTVVTDDWIDTPQVLQHEIGYAWHCRQRVCVRSWVRTFCRRCGEILTHVCFSFFLESLACACACLAMYTLQSQLQFWPSLGGQRHLRGFNQRHGPSVPSDRVQLLQWRALPSRRLARQSHSGN
jgi:hypothetical protein